MKFSSHSADQVSVRRFSTFAGTLMLFLAGTACFGQPNSGWRFWDVADGFEEAYTNSITAGVNGSIWVKHGATTHMNRIDGYVTRSYPDPGNIGKVESALDGTLWIWLAGGLKRFADSRWTSFPVDEVAALGVLRTGNVETWLFTSRTSPFLHCNLILLPLDRDHVLIMLADRILEFDAGTSRTRTVLTLEQTSLKRFAGLRASSGVGMYLSGRGGVGRIRRDAQDVWRWEALPSPPSLYVDFEEPIDAPGGMLVTGVSETSAAAAFRFDGRVWHRVYKGLTRTLRAWPGVAGSVWVQDGDHVIELAGGVEKVAVRNGALSGILLSVLPENPGRFWVTSSQGIAHYMPSLWQTPAEAPPLDDVVNAIAEDRAGRIWFLAAHQLVCLDDGKWSSYPLPKGMMAWAIFTDGLAVLKDGTLAIRTTGTELLLFAPGTHTFRVAKHPQGRRTRILLGQADGTLLVETFAPDSYVDGAIETFDGKSFRPYLQPPMSWRTGDTRSFYVAPTGKSGVAERTLWNCSKGRRGAFTRLKTASRTQAPITSIATPRDA